MRNSKFTVFDNFQHQAMHVISFNVSGLGFCSIHLALFLIRIEQDVKLGRPRHTFLFRTGTVVELMTFFGNFT